MNYLKSMHMHLIQEFSSQVIRYFTYLLSLQAKEGYVSVLYCWGVDLIEVALEMRFYQTFGAGEEYKVMLGLS